jgi:uncharacterized membrane protein YgcG
MAVINVSFRQLPVPQLISIGQDAIHLFLKKREVYLRLVTEAHVDLKPATLVSSVDPDLLENAVILGLFLSSIKDVSEVTDAILRTFWKSPQDTNSLLNAEDLLTQLKTKVVCNINEPDPDLRMTALVSAYRTNLRKFRMPRLAAENPKLAAQHLCELVKPDGLQKIVTADRELHYKELRKDFQGLVKHLRERAVACEQYNGVAKNAAGKNGSASRNGSQSNNGGSNGDGGGAGSTSQQPPASGGGGKGGKKAPPNK